MCGIVGIYRFDRQAEVREESLRAMADAIVHRGPDDEGFFASGNVGLGMRRLSIIDLSGGHQPIFSDDRSRVIVFNGEVYNFGDHRPGLEGKGYAFQTRTDTEVVLHLYQEYGRDFLEKLNGMFGLAIWDDRNQELIVARDRIGIKPLYYYRDAEKLVFASEIKAILACEGVKPELDLQGLGAFLKYGFTPAPLTLFRNIHKIPPANYLRIRDGEVSLNEYWRLDYGPKHTGSEEQVAGELYELLTSSVRYRMIADVPLGAFLSGGMDSSGIVHMMRELGSHHTSTYSIGFGKGYEFYNELEGAGRFAKDYETDHHEILVEPDVVDLFPRLIAMLDEPLADSSFVVTYLVSRLARESSTVILSGVGGDELFGGYRRYLNVQMNRYVKAIPGPLRNTVLKGLLNRVPVDRNNTVLNYFRLAKAYINSVDLPPGEQYSTYTAIFNNDFRRELTIAEQGVPDFFQRYVDGCGSDEPLDQIMYFDLKTSLPEQLLMLTDKMTMATSLEGRVPFLDHRVVEYAARIPGEMKLKGFKLRHIQKKMFEGKLPDYVLNKKKKGFGAPLGSWIRNELSDMVHDLLQEDRLKRQGVFDARTVQRVVSDHYEMREDYSDHLLALIAFQIWYDAYLKTPATQPVG